MPIIDLQRKLHEAGRIRIGERVETEDGGSRPKRLETFRFTSPNEEAVTALAGIHGGIPQVWEDAPTGKQWEVITDSDSLRVLVPPESMSFSQFYELWSAGGCQRRCDGAHLVPSDEPCLCDPDDRECKPHTRISVMLADLPTSGLWRLDTSGYYAAVEVSGGFELASLISRATGRALLAGTLRLEQREVKRPDQPTFKFVVPVLDFDLDLEALTGGTAPAVSPVTPVPALAPRSLADQLHDVDVAPEPSRRANAAEPIKATGRRARTADEARSTTPAGDQRATPRQLETVLNIARRANPENQVIEGEIHECREWLKHRTEGSWPLTDELDKWLVFRLGVATGGATFVGLTKSQASNVISGGSAKTAEAPPEEPPLAEPPPGDGYSAFSDEPFG